MDVSQYLEIFIEESKEHLQSLNDNILILEKEPENEETIHEIFRAAHSLKGMAGTMGFTKMQQLTHDMESVFSEIRNGKMKVTSDLIDVLFKGLDTLENYLGNIQTNGNEGDLDCSDIIASLKQIMDKGLGKAGESEEKGKDKETGKETGKDTEKGTEKEAEKETGKETEKEKTESDTKTEAENRFGKYKFKALTLEDHEKKAVAKAASLNLNVVGMTIYIREDCALKGARAFMINKVLDEHGEIIKLYPNAQDLEDEKFDFDFSAFIVTNETPEKMINYAMSVSEVKEVVADYVRLEERELKAYMDALKKEEGGFAARNADQKKSLQDQAAKLQKHPGKPLTNRSVRVDIEKLDDLMNLVSELIIAKNSLVSYSSAFDQQANPEFFEQLEYLERITSGLHESVMKVRMVPIELVVNRFPRMIRDLSKTLGKEMELYMSGEDTELDRTVIDEIGDPLMHLLRNAADHGLESREERIKLGKNPVGSIYLNAYQDGNNVVIEVRDDGSGIDVENVKRIAIKRGVITQEQADGMSERDIIDILFLPSFSTSSKVSDISGRGVGLDVVKTKIEALGGEVETRTKLHEGTTFTIRLPLTLAIMQALMIKISNEEFALPLGNIQSVENITRTDIKRVNNKEVLNLRDTVIPIIRLGDVLDCEKGRETDEIFVVVVKKGERMAGLVVDEILGQQEIVIKSIGKYIKAHKVVSGATILGNGDIALILDVNSLI